MNEMAYRKQEDRRTDMARLFTYGLTYIRILLPIIALLLLVTKANAQEGPASPGGAAIAPDRLLVQYKSDAPVVTEAASIDGISVKVVDTLAEIRTQVLQVPPQRLGEIYAQLQRDPNVQSVSYDVVTEVAAIPDDPYLVAGMQWAPQQIQAPEAWDLSTGEDVIIAVVDSGVAPDHPDLRQRLIPGYNLYDNNDNTADGCGHGTHMAGIVAATTNNHEGVAGIAHAANIMPVKVMNDACSGSYSRLIRGIIYAVDQDARIIVISSGATVESGALRDALIYARSRGVFIAAAAGNNSGSALFYPAAYPEVMSVAGTDQNDQRYTLSNFGNEIDIAAPANHIYSTYWSADTGSTYEFMSGTSMASPHVAGVAALLWARNPQLSVQAIEEIIRTSADDLGAPGWDPYFGAGRVNALRAVMAADSPPIPTPTAEPTPAEPPVATTPAPPGKTSHIEVISISYVQHWPWWMATAQFWVVDQTGNAIPDASVQVQWGGAYTAPASCITKSDGTCSVTTAYLVQGGGALSLEVDTIQHPAVSYDPTLNNVSLPMEGIIFQNQTAAVPLTAIVNHSTVQLRWSLQPLPEIHQIALYRSETGNPEDAQRIKVEEIMAQGNSAVQEYHHTDTAVSQGETYTYWLVQMDGEEPVAELGRVTVEIGESATHRIYVPVVNH